MIIFQMGNTRLCGCGWRDFHGRFYLLWGYIKINELRSYKTEGVHEINRIVLKDSFFVLR